MSKHRICATATGLPNETLNEIHDCLTLALDATEGKRIAKTSMREARSYIRAALRNTDKIMQGAK